MTHSRFGRLLLVGLLGFLIAASPAVSHGAKGDCGQPLSTADRPTTGDALTILHSSVGRATSCDVDPCICDVNASGSATVTDALAVLQVAVGDLCASASCPLACTFCDSFEAPCTSARIHSRAEGSELDIGWTGVSHDSPSMEGSSITVRVVRRCSDDQSVCLRDEDCGNDDCRPTCDCSTDTTCEFTGPTGEQRCFGSLDECVTNSDCAVGLACKSHLGPPVPLSSGGTPICVVSTFEGPITGTANAATGEAQASATLHSWINLGIQLDRPCPTCGTVDEAPVPGAEFTCGGGPNDGESCTVDAVSPVFGGVSYDCPPHFSIAIGGNGVTTRFASITTGTTTRTAQIPCGNPAFKANNPLTPGSAPKCTDRIGPGDPVCSTNADCRRCTGDPTVACASNAECTGKGSCGEAPDQPVTCGYWCHCGFCNDNPDLPCIESADCPDGQQCVAGTGGIQSENHAQQKPNDCSGADKHICGLLDEEECATAKTGRCSLQPYRNCTAGSTTCEDNSGGTCILSPRSCFEPRITRSGDPSPLGVYCAYENKACTTNADCTAVVADYCVPDSARPETVALTCAPATASTSINNVLGITGPAAVRLQSFVEVCRCGDERLGCDETCDDGNAIRGDGCDDYCRQE